MTITGAVVLFAILWWMTFFIVLPLRFTSQRDAGVVVPGTPASAPADFQVARKEKITTAVAAGLWIVFAAIITSGLISVEDFDINGVIQENRDALKQ